MCGPGIDLCMAAELSEGILHQAEVDVKEGRIGVGARMEGARLE